MGDRIGAFRQVIPVTSKANVPRNTAPLEPPPESEITWSKQSNFKYSTLEIDPVPAGGGVRFGSGATVKHPARIEYETRIESFPSAVMWITEDYQVRFHGTGPEPEHNFDNMATQEYWTEAWYFLGSEQQQEIVGYTATRYGVTERFKSREVEYYIHLTFKHNAIPRKQGVFHKYGELPPA